MHVNNKLRVARQVINIDFCGDSVTGNGWRNDRTCYSQAQTCQQFVARNPDAFSEAYWLFNSIKLYQKA